MLVRRSDADFRRLRLLGERRRHDDERERDDEQASHAAPRHITRRSAQRRKDASRSPKSCESASTGSIPSARKRRTRSSQRASCSTRSRAVSRRDRKTGAARPPPGSEYTTLTPPTSGNVRSHSGSWRATGTSSQLCSSARSHASTSSGARKSDRTKTNACVGRSRRCSPRKSSPRAIVSEGARKERSKVPLGASRSERGGRQYTSPSA